MRHQCKAKMDIPWKTDKSCTRPYSVNSLLDLNVNPQAPVCVGDVEWEKERDLGMNIAPCFPFIQFQFYGFMKIIKWLTSVLNCRVIVNHNSICHDNSNFWVIFFVRHRKDIRKIISKCLTEVKYCYSFVPADQKHPVPTPLSPLLCKNTTIPNTPFHKHYHSLTLSPTP